MCWCWGHLYSRVPYALCPPPSLPVFSHPFLSLGCSLSFSLDNSVAHSLKHTHSLFAVCSLALLLSLAHARALSLSLFHGFSHGLFGEGVRVQTAMGEY